MTKLLLLFVVLGVTFVPVLAQDQPAQQQPAAEDQDKEKAEREKNAYRLLDQVIDEAQSLRLTENRVRVQIMAADLLWDSNQARARSLFTMAGEGVAELSRTQQNTNNRRGGGGPPNRSFQLRQELVLAAARHDAQLAYQLLAATKAAAPTIEVDQTARNRIQFSPDDNLEQTLLGRVAALDPKLAATNAEQMMDKGTFPRTMPDVLTQLQKQDADAAAKLADKTVKKLEAANLLTNNDAATLAQLLIMAGPRAADANSRTTTTATPTTGRAPVLDQSSYVDLLGNVVDLALKATPVTQATARPAVQENGNVRRGAFSENFEPKDAQFEKNGS